MIGRLTMRMQQPRNVVLISLALALAFLSIAAGRYAFAASADINTVLLMHMDGPDTSAVFTDTSNYDAVTTAAGNAQIDTAQSKFSGASYLGDGNGDFVSIADDARFEFGTGNFTIDLWVRPAAAGSNDGVISKAVNGNGYTPWIIYTVANGADSTMEFYSSSNGASWDICNGTSFGTVTTNVWTHLAVVRNGTTFTVYKDGVAQNTCTSSGSLYNNTASVTIGDQTDGGTLSFNGWIDEVRISNVARWTTDFTPPTEYYKGGIELTDTVSVSGNAQVLGTISKGSGTFVIDHPLDPKNKLLYHSFVESPEVKNLYDGVVRLDGRGEATIELPSYFLALNEDYRYQLTPHGNPMPDLYVSDDVGRKWGFTDTITFSIAGGGPNGLVSWQVTGNRRDRFIKKYPIVTEVDKGSGQVAEKGECLFEPLCK